MLFYLLPANHPDLAHLLVNCTFCNVNNTSILIVAFSCYFRSFIPFFYNFSATYYTIKLEFLLSCSCHFLLFFSIMNFLHLNFSFLCSVLSYRQTVFIYIYILNDLKVKKRHI